MVHMIVILPVKLECEKHQAGKGADSPIDLVRKSVSRSCGQREDVSYLPNEMSLFRAVPRKLLIVAMNALPMGAWPVVCNQILRSESRTATLGLMRLCDGWQRLDDIDSLESSTQRGCNRGPSASLLGFSRVRYGFLEFFSHVDPVDTRANPACLVCFLSLWNNEPGRWAIYISNSMLQTLSGIADPMGSWTPSSLCFCFLDAIVVPRHRDNRLYVANDVPF